LTTAECSKTQLDWNCFAKIDHISEQIYIGLNHGFEREIKRAMFPLGAFRWWSFLNVHLNPRKTLNHHPLQNQLVASVSRARSGIWKLNRIYITRRSPTSSGSLGELPRKPTGYRVWTQLKFRNSRSVHVHYLLRWNEKKREREAKKWRNFTNSSCWPIVIYS